MHHFLKTIRILLASALTIVSALPDSITLLGGHSNSDDKIARREPVELIPFVIDNHASGDMYIKTRVHPGEDKSKDGLYMDIYETSPLQYAVVLQKEPLFQVSLEGFNLTFPDISSEQVYTLDMNEMSERLMSDYNTDDGWVPVFINPFTNRPKAVFATQNNDTLIWLSPRFQGWLVCDWALQEPQLFRINDDRYDAGIEVEGIPSSCAEVDLVLSEVDDD